MTRSRIDHVERWWRTGCHTGAGSHVLVGDDADTAHRIITLLTTDPAMLEAELAMLLGADPLAKAVRVLHAIAAEHWPAPIDPAACTAAADLINWRTP